MKTGISFENLKRKVEKLQRHNEEELKQTMEYVEQLEDFYKEKETQRRKAHGGTDTSMEEFLSADLSRNWWANPNANYWVRKLDMTVDELRRIREDHLAAKERERLG